MPFTSQNQYSDNSPKNRTHTNANSLTPAPVKSYSERAKFSWDCYSLNRRHTRQRAAGYLEPVDYAHRGFMPGSRGLKNDLHHYESDLFNISVPMEGVIDRNKRVAYRLGDSRTRQFLPTAKNLIGAQAMCNQTTGVVRLPIPVSGESASNISFIPFYPGKVATVNGSMVGAIYPGECKSTRNHETFYDVVFPRVTFAADGERPTGSMLDQVTLGSEQAAIDFLTKLVLGEVSEVQA